MRTLSIAVFCAVAFRAAAQMPFSLDTSFRTSIVQQNVNSVAVLNTGDLLLSGQIKFPGDMSTRYLAKVDSNGDQVSGFPYSYGGGRISAWNGQFYVNSGTVHRLLPDGLLDPSFINMNTGPYFNFLQGGDYHVYPDGRILMSGTHTLSDTVRGFVGNYDLIWFSNEGYLDTTRIHRRGNGAVYRFEELDGGGFICNGTGSQFENLPVDRIFRTDSLGIPDTTFHTDVFIGSVGDYIPLSDGRVYACGNFQSTQAPGDTLRLVRFLPSGGLDPDFAIPQFDDGAYDWPYGAYVNAMYPWSDGRIIAMGQFQFVNGEPRYGICMLDSTGSLLQEFENCGVDSFTWFGLPYASIGGLVVDTAAGSLYISGAYKGYNDGVINDTTQRFVSRLFLGSPSTHLPQAPKQGSDFGVYPNPASTWAALTYRLGDPAQRGSITVRELSGRIVAELPMAGAQGQQVLDTRHLAAGAYNVEFKADGNVLHAERLIVRP